jgi:predicted TIM-barrel fold metal-dependent hydrolase
MRVIDSDGHVVEPVDLWDRYIDSRFYDDRPICDPRTIAGIEVVGRKMSRSYGQGGYGAAAEAGTNRKASKPIIGIDPSAQIAMMDAEGIDTMVLYPSRGLYAVAVDDMSGELVSAIVTAYNRWLHDFCSHNPQRLIGIGLAGLQDPDRAIADVTYAASELGMRGIMIRPNPCGNRNLHDPAYDGFYSAIEELDLPLSIHEGCGVWMPEYGVDRFSEHIAWHAMSHPMEQMGAVLSLTVGGVLERHPLLRIAILEAGGSWLPYWLHRLDDHVTWLRDIEVRELKSLPSEYFRRQGWISIEADEPGLSTLIEFVGIDRLLWASDYPHPDAHYPGVLTEMNHCTAFDDAGREMVLSHNPQALYQI